MIFREKNIFIKIFIKKYFYKYYSNCRNETTMSENKNMSSEISTSNDDCNTSNKINEEIQYSDYEEEEEEDNEDNHHRRHDHDHDNHHAVYGIQQQHHHNNTNDENENRRSKENKPHRQLTVLSDRNLNMKRKYDG